MESGCQIVVGNLSHDVRVEDIVEALASVGLVWRCKLKTTAPPTHERLCLTTEDAERPDCKLKTPHFACHAYVHFVSPQVANEACRLAKFGRLICNGMLLKAQIAEDGWKTRKPHICQLRFVDVSIECGTLFSWEEFLVSWKSPLTGVTIEVDKIDKRCRIRFFHDTLFCAKDTSYGETWSRCEFKLEILFRDIKFIHEAKCRLDSVEGSSLLLQLVRPPWIYYRMADAQVYHKTSFLLPDDKDPWMRTVDFTLDRSIGRHLSYLLNFSPRQMTSFRKVKDCFQKEGLHLKQTLPSLKLPYEVKCRSQRSDYFYTVPYQYGVRFDHLFLLNSLVHKGIVNQSSLTKGLFTLMMPRVTKPEVVTFALKHMLEYSNPIFDATRRLEKILHWASLKPQLVQEVKGTESLNLVYRLVITPTKAYCTPPEYEVSNRILRNFKDHLDRFLRVSFLDDNLQVLKPGVLSSSLSPFIGDKSFIKTAIYRRVLAILHEGFFLCGRHYSFLAFSANQLREHSAWFFAYHRQLHVGQIRAWMGEIPTRVVAKCAARMGQSFSSTYATVKIRPTEFEQIKDIIHDGHNFSDGIGKLTPSLAKEIADILKLKGAPPSAYQIRYAGYKGVVATWAPENPKSSIKLSLRVSMEKFSSTHQDLEVVGWTRFFPCFLNRQIITLLSTLHVSDSAFMDLQKTMLSRLTSFPYDPTLALEVLTSSCSGELQQTAILMLRAGFEVSSEPHLKEMLQAIRVMQMAELLTKARIFVHNGRWLMGCLDESSKLQYGQCFIRVTTPDKNGGPDSSLTIITGTIIMTKNPCLHPGDIRILEAVDVPELYHLVDALVLPQHGPRPHQDEASGSDLDGDVYFVCWESSLIPPSRMSWEPMEYVQPNTMGLGRHVKIDDIVEFFARHMITDSLGKICNAHVVHADLSPIGALDEKCLQLAELAALAVDVAKTGVPVVMPPELRPKKYPDFMAKTDCDTYTSEKILGILYRSAKGYKLNDADKWHDLESVSTQDIFYDSDLEVPGFEQFCDDAWEIKCSYEERLRALMGQFNVLAEGEIVTGCISSAPGQNSRKIGDLRERSRNAYLSVREEFRAIFESGESKVNAMVSEFGDLTASDNDEACSELSGKQNEEEKMKNVRESKASAWYHVTYHKSWVDKSIDALDPEISFTSRLFSFPWVVAEVLCDIKAAANTKRLCRLDN